jgi:flavin-dependent dehydrogenase
LKVERDVCVFGSGPAGLAVAARLLERGHDAVILDCPPRERPWGGESFTGAIRAPLEALGAWDAFERAGHTRGFELQSAWGGELTAESSILRAFGPMWHVDRERFDRDLRSVVVRRPGMLHSYRRLASISRESGSWRLVLDGEREIHARFLVDATGRSRALARRLNATIAFDDRLLGLCVAVSREESDPGIRSMILEATPFGWWYAAPTPHGHVLAFFTDADLVPSELQGRLRSVAANSAFTNAGDATGWLPVGDAYASHDPLCGWGVHRALSNGLRAGDAIGSYLSNGEAAGLAAYHRHCRLEYETYLKGLVQRYSFERRWPAAPFWARRLSRPAA